MPIYANFITGGVNNHTTTSEEANSLATDFVGNGVIGTTTNTSGIAPMTGGYAVNAQGTPNMTVAVSSGVAYVTATPSGQGSQKIRIYSTASENVTINANSSGSVRYDWIYIAVSAANAAAPNLAGDNVGSLVASRSTSLTSDNGTPPTFGTLIAVVTVANGATSITNGNIRDARNQSVITATSANETGWISSRNGVTLPVPSTVTYSGNRSYSLAYTGGDLTTYLSNGMRIRTTRTVAAPTYMGGLFNGTSHYFTKTTATSTLSTVTNNWTIMGWAEPTAYQAEYICGRSDAAANNAFGLGINASGQVFVIITNGGVANTRQVATYQSLPLNKKTHIAASWTSGTVVIYFDGVSVPVAPASTGGTAPTVAGTGGDWSIGRLGGFTGGSNYYAGYASGFGVFDAVLSASTIRSYSSQVLSGSETNCIGAWSLNNTGVNQQAAGTNDLTATGGVSYTVRSPYATDANGVPSGTTDYAIVTNVATTTLTVQVPEGCAIPTSGGVSAIAYSTQASPYGFTTDKGRWIVRTIVAATRTGIGIGAINIWISLTHNITVPVGAGTLKTGGLAYLQNSTVVGTRSFYLLLFPGTPTNNANTYELSDRAYSTASSGALVLVPKMELDVNLSTQTVYTMFGAIDQATGSETFQVLGSQGIGGISWMPAGI